MPTMNKGGHAPVRKIPILLAIAWPAYAQGLGDALEQAWTRHPQAAAVSAREDAARARADVAAGITPGPASMSLSSLNDRLNRNRGKQEWEVEMAVPLWLPGQQAARAAEAESAVMEVAARRAAPRLQVAGEVREAWWTVAAARNARDLARRRATTAGALEADVLRRFKAGDLARIDANLAQGERLAAEAEAIEVEAALLQAEQAYRNLVGAGAPSVLTERGAGFGTRTGENHPQLAAAAARTARAKLRVAARKPAVMRRSLPCAWSASGENSPSPTSTPSA